MSCFTFIACEGGELQDSADDFLDNDLVEVKMALSAGASVNASTRMTTENTQADNGVNTYRGIDKLYLIPFSSSIPSESPVNEASLRLQKNSAYTSHEVSYQQENNRENRVYDTFLVPSGTNSFLVYAWPDGGGPDAASDDKFAYGSLIPVGLDVQSVTTDRANGITVRLDKVWDDDEGESYVTNYDKAKEVATYLSNVAKANVDGEPLYKQKGTIGDMFLALSHDGYPFPYDAPYIQQKLKDLSDYFKNYKGTQAVYNEINKNNNYYKFTNGTWDPLSNLIVYPNGVFLFKWDEGEEKFVLLDSRNSKSIINPPIMNHKYLSYPAQLWYYANTPIHTSTEDLQNNVFNDTWSNVLNDPRFKADGNVSYDTKVVAVDKKIDYAVGRLATKIHVGSSNSSLPGLPQINQLQLKGVMVTHQYKAGYDFQALETDNTESDDDPYYVIYDRDVKTKNDKGEITPIIPPGKNKWSDPNHTLVLPSRPGQKVFIILEMFYNGSYKVGSDTSNAPTLTGYKGYPILPQSYFYMVGQLDPGAAKKAFESDKVATVNASINSLEGAYNYVPDLNSPALVLGLKIELTWQQAEPKSVWLH